MSRGMPSLKAARAAAEAKTPSVVLKPMNCRTVVGTAVLSAWPLADTRSLVGSARSSSTRREEKRYMAVSLSLAWTRGMVSTGSASCRHQLVLATRESLSLPVTKT